MKAIAHAWLALMALERLKKPKKSKTSGGSFLEKNFRNYFISNNFDKHFEKQAESFVKFFDKHKDAFVKGAWFPDSVIADNLTGGHTLKFKRPIAKEGKKHAMKIENRTPDHLSSFKNLKSENHGLKKKFVKDLNTLFLTDVKH